MIGSQRDALVSRWRSRGSDNRERAERGRWGAGSIARTSTGERKARQKRRPEDRDLRIFVLWDGRAWTAGEFYIFTANERMLRLSTVLIPPQQQIRNHKSEICSSNAASLPNPSYTPRNAIQLRFPINIRNPPPDSRGEPLSQPMDDVQESRQDS
eukprot:scaffold2598_cov190-Pinguiococcus_pyrenoidosus.AAC.2